MIVFLTTAAWKVALTSLTGPGCGFGLPEIRVESYDRVVRQSQLPAATYIFCDLERLSDFELQIAASLHQAIVATGLRTLNNPARVKLRYELLRDLAARGITPFSVYRCDDNPRPQRFPVFLRFEAGHIKPLPALVPDQATLDKTIEALKRNGYAAASMLVVECVPSDRIEGRWHKWGAFGVSGETMLDHIAVDDNWLVKTGKWDLLTPGIVTLENQAVRENHFAEFASQAFALANIDFGRADFARSGGKPMLFEINTNPFIYDLKPDPHELRQQTIETARRRLAGALFRIDSDHGGTVEVQPDFILEYCRKTPRGISIAPPM